ncbi:MAG: xanthan lyase [Opitutaceae bacterium]|nr:xanthan lyase [Opitutaceae bacterium]|tara:strand:- start:1933 stop:3603 length:1671 start_codon:yes stop_codon:yes gene_type:complete
MVRWVSVLLLFDLVFGFLYGSNPFYYRPSKDRSNDLVNCEVAVYGGTPAGVTAAIQASRMGRKVILISFNKYVGGLTSGGLTDTDLGQKDSIGGLAAEFYQRVGRLTDFGAAEAEELFVTMLDEAGVRILYERPLDSVTIEDGKISKLFVERGEVIHAKMFIDATYEGDLLAAANVSYRVGREPSKAFGESLGGQWQKVSWKNVYQFCRLPISPFIVPGDSTSGLLPEISPHPPGELGDGDYRVQAYNFRMILSDAEEKIPFPKPAVYDAGRYALLARFLNFDRRVEWRLDYTTDHMTDGPVRMRNGDSNNAGSFSSDYVDGAHRWPDGTFEPTSFAKLPPPRRGLPMSFRELYKLREKIFQSHVNYQQGLMYFLANDPKVPLNLQSRVRQFGLDPKEFRDTSNWPHQLYVREGRRMVSDYVMTEANCRSERIVKDSIGLASYAMDSHFCQRVVVEENGVTTVRNEGGFGQNLAKPYPIAYRSIVPKIEECTNLLVPVCLSASHVAFGSIRMEPVFMIMGQSAGAAACIALADEVSVQAVDYKKLRAQLVAAKQKL